MFVYISMYMFPYICISEHSDYVLCFFSFMYVCDCDIRS